MLSCRLLYSFWANFLHSHTVCPTFLPYSPYILQSGDLVVLSILYLKELVLNACFWAAHINASVSTFWCDFLNHSQAFALFVVSGISLINCPYILFSFHSLRFPFLSFLLNLTLSFVFSVSIASVFFTSAINFSFKVVLFTLYKFVATYEPPTAFLSRHIYLINVCLLVLCPVTVAVFPSFSFSPLRNHPIIPVLYLNTKTAHVLMPQILFVSLSFDFNNNIKLFLYSLANVHWIV